VGVNIFRTPADVLLFNCGHPYADGGFDFTLCFHMASNVPQLLMG
jgi:hypothetical protein